MRTRTAIIAITTAACITGGALVVTELRDNPNSVDDPNTVDGTAVISMCVTDSTRQVQHIDTASGDVEKTRYFNVHGSIATCDTQFKGSDQASAFRNDFSELLVVRKGADGMNRLGWLKGASSKNGKQPFEPINSTATSDRLFSGAYSPDSKEPYSYVKRSESGTFLMSVGDSPDSSASGVSYGTAKSTKDQMVYRPNGAAQAAVIDVIRPVSGQGTYAESPNPESVFKDGYGFKDVGEGVAHGSEQQILKGTAAVAKSDDVPVPIKAYGQNDFLAYGGFLGIVKVHIEGNKLTMTTVFADGQLFADAIAGPDDSVLYSNYGDTDAQLYTAELGSTYDGRMFRGMKSSKYSPVSLMAFTD